MNDLLAINLRRCRDQSDRPVSKARSVTLPNRRKSSPVHALSSILHHTGPAVTAHRLSGPFLCAQVGIFRYARRLRVT